MAQKEINRKRLIIIRRPPLDYSLKTGVLIDGKIYYFRLSNSGNKFLGIT